MKKNENIVNKYERGDNTNNRYGNNRVQPTV